MHSRNEKVSLPLATLEAFEEEWGPVERPGANEIEIAPAGPAGSATRIVALEPAL